MEESKKITCDSIRVRFRVDRCEYPLVGYCEMELMILGIGVFVCHSIKLVRHSAGEIRVTFPSSVVRRPCDSCRLSIPMGSHFCHRCGAEQKRVEEPVRRDEFHPLNGPTRDAITKFIIQEFEKFGGPKKHGE